MGSFSIHLAAGSWWVLAVSLVIAVGLSVWTYRHTVPATTPARRRSLIALRTVAMMLVLFVLFEPIFTVSKTQERSPRIAFLLDNSRSMLLPSSSNDTSTSRLAAMKKNLSAILPQAVLQGHNTSMVELFGEKATMIDTPLVNGLSLMQADGASTDISEAIRLLGDKVKSENLSAVVMMTDGEYTAGANPLYAAENLGIPIFTVGIGDSTERRDVGITSLFTNDVATLGASQPVDISVHAAGAVSGDRVLVSLFAENEKIAEEPVELKNGTSDQDISFDFVPKQEGTVKLTAKISPLPNGEASLSNNISIRYVNVLKNKFHIALFAGAPSSDVSFIRDYFRDRKEIDLATYIQKQGAEFYEGSPTFDKLKDADLIILIGFPIASSSSESVALVKRLVVSEGKSLFFVPSRSIDPEKLKQLDEALPFIVRDARMSSNELAVSASVSQATISNPILRADKSQTAATKWESLAPLSKTETHFAPKPESEMLIEATMQGVKIGEPLLLSRSVGRSRQIAFTGYGLWKWKLTSFGREKAFASLSRVKDSTAGSESALDMLLGNATRWLVMHDDRKHVRIEPTQKTYDAGEKIEFAAQVYDQSFEPVDNAIVTLKIAGQSLKAPIEMTLAPLPNGRYTGYIAQGLAAGDYSFSGQAMLDGKSIGTDGGRFNVGEYSIEFAEPRMRSDLLREIAARTGGTFYTLQNDSSIMHDIRSLSSFAVKRIEEQSEYEARTAWYMLALAIALFSTEWFIRKRLGML